MTVTLDSQIPASASPTRAHRTAFVVLSSIFLAGVIFVVKAALPYLSVTEAQFENASSVLQVLACLTSRLPVSRDAIESGLRTVQLGGRFQVIPGAVDWILDVAHNPAAAKTFAAQLRQDPGRRRTLAVCGILGDKDIEGIVGELRGSIDEWIVAGLSGARAVATHELAARMRRMGANVVAMAESVGEACQITQQRAAAGDRVIVFGSFLTVGPAIEWLETRVTT